MSAEEKETIESQLTSEFKAALRQKDERRVNVIRMVRSEASRAKTAPGFAAELDDAFYVAVIGAYVKKIAKAQAEYEQLGERGQKMAAELAFEVEYLSRWLPQKLDEQGTRELVQSAIAELAVSDPRQVGRVIGHLMKSHKEKLDGALVKKIATEELSRS